MTLRSLLRTLDDKQKVLFMRGDKVVTQWSESLFNSQVEHVEVTSKGTLIISVKR